MPTYALLRSRKLLCFLLIFVCHYRIMIPSIDLETIEFPALQGGRPMLARGSP